MKRSVVLVVGIMLALGFASLVMAQTPAKPTHKVFSGTVEKVTPADKATSTKAQVVVVGLANKSMTFVVVDTCTCYDAKGGTITLDKIVKGLGVKVTYATNAQGVHEATSIKLLK
jgi:hypothetical protein